MDRERSNEDDAAAVDEPGGPPPDEGRAFDPDMTDGDEGNIPPESEADPASDS